MKRKVKHNEGNTKARAVQDEQCDICGAVLSKRMYRKYSGFCKKCYKLYFED